MVLRVLDLGDDPEEVGGYNGRKYYRLATITWSPPREWRKDERCFDVPNGWAGHGGVYAFIRNHKKQKQKQIAYVGKAISFQKRLINTHDHFDIIERPGETLVSCGRIAFERIRSHVGYYLEIEELIKFSVLPWIENVQGLESLPGFRKTQARAMVPWVITNEGYRFGRMMPKRIVYPSIGIDALG